MDMLRTIIRSIEIHMCRLLCACKDDWHLLLRPYFIFLGDGPYGDMRG